MNRTQFRATFSATRAVRRDAVLAGRDVPSTILHNVVGFHPDRISIEARDPSTLLLADTAPYAVNWAHSASTFGRDAWLCVAEDEGDMVSRKPPGRVYRRLTVDRMRIDRGAALRTNFRPAWGPRPGERCEPLPAPVAPPARPQRASREPSAQAVFEALPVETREALAAFAARHGRTWKSKLRMLWTSGADEREADGGHLRRVRNTVGPSGLDKLRLA